MTTSSVATISSQLFSNKEHALEKNVLTKEGRSLRVVENLEKRSISLMTDHELEDFYELAKTSPEKFEHLLVEGQLSFDELASVQCHNRRHLITEIIAKDPLVIEKLINRDLVTVRDLMAHKVNFCNPEGRLLEINLFKYFIMKHVAVNRPCFLTRCLKEGWIVPSDLTSYELDNRHNIVSELASYRPWALTRLILESNLNPTVFAMDDTTSWLPPIYYIAKKSRLELPMWIVDHEWTTVKACKNIHTGRNNPNILDLYKKTHGQTLKNVVDLYRAKKELSLKRSAFECETQL